MYMKTFSVTIPQQQYFPVVLLVIPHKVLLTSESVDETLKYVKPIRQYFPVSVLQSGAKF